MTSAQIGDMIYFLAMGARPRLFVGSSTEYKPLAEALCSQATDKAIAIGWWASPEFANGYASLDALLKATETYDFAAFLLTADDERTMRSVSGRVPRDNVVFEYGLFLGRLRQGRVLGFVEAETKLPSDVAGIQMERFQVPKDSHERIATASRLAGIVASAIDQAVAWWDLHLGDVIVGWSVDPLAESFSVRLSKESLNVRSATFMDRQLLLVVRRENDVVGPMSDTNIGLSAPRRYTALDKSVRLVATSPTIIGQAPEGTVLEARLFVVPDGFKIAKSIEDIIAQGGRLVAGVTRPVRRTDGK